MNKRRITEWVIIFLIVLFFAIPVCSLAFSDTTTVWPRSSTSILYSLVSH